MCWISAAFSAFALKLWSSKTLAVLWMSVRTVVLPPPSNSFRFIPYFIHPLLEVTSQTETEKCYTLVVKWGICTKHKWRRAPTIILSITDMTLDNALIKQSVCFMGWCTAVFYCFSWVTLLPGWIWQQLNQTFFNYYCSSSISTQQFYVILLDNCWESTNTSTLK